MTLDLLKQNPNKSEEEIIKEVLDSTDSSISEDTIHIITHIPRWKIAKILRKMYKWGEIKKTTRSESWYYQKVK